MIDFALGDLLGGFSFISLRWAAILAVAFCAIDFAGLTYLFSLDRNSLHHQGEWYLIGAWLLGATMNALMTWWAISLILLNQQSGYFSLSHHEWLSVVPIVVALLAWVIRILFIAAAAAVSVR